MTADTTHSTSRSLAVLRALQVFAVLSVLNLAWQFFTAGRLFPGPVDIHAAGAIVLHVTSGLTAIAAAVLWFRDRTTPWPAVVAVVVFVYSFIQAYTGDRSSLAVHIPGAMLLVVGATYVMVWSFGRSARA